MYEFEDFDDEFDEGGSRRWVWIGAAALLVLVIGFVIARSASSDTVAFPTTTDDPSITSAESTSPTSTIISLVEQPDPTATQTTERITSTTAATVAPVTTDAPPADEPATTDPPATTDAPVTTDAPTADDGDEVTDEPTYPTAPDGTPIPIRVAFDSNTISMTGFAPSADAVQRLSDFAVAFSKSPDANVVQDITIDPSVPTTIGVRFVELNSVRFRAGSTDVSADHAREFDRIVNVMNLLPDTSVVVIGHANWPTDQEKNFGLASQRALSVASYIVSQGIDPGRVSARVGEAGDLLANGSSERALALNRRTEFIFSGLLI